MRFEIASKSLKIGMSSEALLRIGVSGFGWVAVLAALVFADVTVRSRMLCIPISWKKIAGVALESLDNLRLAGKTEIGDDVVDWAATSTVVPAVATAAHLSRALERSISRMIGGGRRPLGAGYGIWGSLASYPHSPALFRCVERY